MNHAYCNLCEALVPAKQLERDGRVFLVKECPDCGPTEALLSSNAASYWRKRGLDEDFQYSHC